MSLSLALMFQIVFIQPNSDEPAKPRFDLVRGSPEKATFDIIQRKCTFIHSTDGKSFAVSLEEIGGQGFAYENDPGKSGVTPRQLVVKADESGLLAGVEFAEEAFPNKRFKYSFSQKYKVGDDALAMVTTYRMLQFEKGENSTEAVRLSKGFQDNYRILAVGICDLTSVPQKPLSSSEVEKFLAS